MKKTYIEKLDFENVHSIEALFKALLEEPADSAKYLESWLLKQSLLFDALQEGLMRHSFDFHGNSSSAELKRIVEHDQSAIRPLIKKYTEALNAKYMKSPYREALDPEVYRYYDKRVVNAQELFHPDNVGLDVEEAKLVNAYFEKTGGLMIEWDGEEKPVSEVQAFYQDPDRGLRKQAYKKVHESIAGIEEPLQEIMNNLVTLRQEKAENAGVANYRDYMFKEYERFDYTPEDCRTLAESVRKYGVPLKEKMQEVHKRKLGVETYRPYDIYATPADQETLKPFNTIEELISGVKTVLDRVDPDFGHLLDTMNEKGLLDLDSRKGKSPGGFCEPLPVTKLSLIFMNTAKTPWDVLTLIHEMGHCIHHDLFMELPLSKYREVPMESAELASMSMELLTMEHWDVFYKNEKDFNRAKEDHLRGILDFLPFGVVIDQFQHWMYENPGHTTEERNRKFKSLQETYNSSLVDWSGFEDVSAKEWLDVLHVFEVPFYFIEYLIAQLGALQLYRAYQKQPHETLRRFKAALSLGSSVPLADIYETAGIQFDFSEAMVKELMAFVEEEIAAIQHV